MEYHFQSIPCVLCSSSKHRPRKAIETARIAFLRVNDCSFCLGAHKTLRASSAFSDEK